MYHFQHPFDPYQHLHHRETATLLAASMESHGSDTQAMKLSAYGEKQDAQDDGYETSGDLEIRGQQSDSQKLYTAMHQALKSSESSIDPYSFVEEEHILPHHLQGTRNPTTAGLLEAIPKKRGRKKKLKDGEEGLENTENFLNAGDLMKKKKAKEGEKGHIKERKKHDRFNGMPEEEVSKRTLPDHLAQNLDIVIIGINPGLFAAYKGHHYAGPGNHFWKCLYLSGITPEPMTADDDFKLLQYGVGFTNMVSRATKGSADLTRKEIKEGSQILLEKLRKFKPKVAVFNGKLIYEVFSGKKDFNFGRQPDFVDGTNTYMWVMPSSSARCAQLPRAADKVPFYAALKKFRDYLNGVVSDLDETDVVFPEQKIKNITENDAKDECEEKRTFYPYGRLPSNGELTDLSNAIVKKDGDLCGSKKKRGRPKKMKGESGMDIESPSRSDVEMPPITIKDHHSDKKKRGRPKKLKMDHENNMIPNGLPDHTSSSIPMSNCFSPPIQSPNNFCQNFSPSYNTQVFNTQNQSPSYHQSPAHRYSQSPQPGSQAFTHSDLSSEISAAISSEHNLASPSPTSPTDFEPPTNMPEDTNENTSKDDNSSGEATFSSPTPSKEAPPPASSSITYPSYGSFSSENSSNNVATGIGYNSNSANSSATITAPPDVASKSLSGLESLVDQIPSITEGDSAVANPTNHYESTSSQYNDESNAVYSAYSNSYSVASSVPANYSPSTNYATVSSYSSLHPSSASMNFSVSSLANSSSSATHDPVSSSFSVTSLASSNYSPMNSSYTNFPHHMGGHHMMSAPNSMGVGGSMFGTSAGLPNMPYPYSQYSAPPSSYPSAPAGAFPYTASHSLHMPSPNYPYYTNSPYPQAGYLQNHVLDRIKQDQIGFGGF